MYACDNCKHIFTLDDAIKKETSWERYNGVSDLFPNSTPLTLYLCPECESEDKEEASQCVQCEKYFHPDDINWDLCAQCEKEMN